ncbi:MAG: SLC13/DASS family transporter [Bacteroidia bacterium]|nr:SLC13/DASS family transporter [Bacteroidia bacterium]
MKKTKYISSKPLRSVVVFLLCILVAMILQALFSNPGFSDSQHYVLFLLFFSIALWFTEVIPPFAVGLLIMSFLVFALGNPYFNSAPENIERYVTTFSSSIIWLMLGGFFLAVAMTKTKLDEALFRFTIQLSGTKPRNLLIGLMGTTMVASMLMSNTATTAMIIAAVTPLLLKLGKEAGLTKALLLGVPIAATLGGMGTIIGTPPNAIAAGALEHAGIRMNFLSWLAYGMPLAVVLTAIACLVLIVIFVKNNQPLDLDFIKTNDEPLIPELKLHRRIVLTVIVITILLWLMGSLFDITVASVSAFPIVVLTLTRILKGDDIRALPWDTLLLVAGGLSLGIALQQTGLLEIYADKIGRLNIGSKGFLFLFAFLTMVLSNIMSNTAASTVLIPLGMAILPEMKTEIAMIVGLCASTALFLPVSTPPNAIAYSTGLIEQKDFRLGGALIGILGPLLVILWVLFIS